MKNWPFYRLLHGRVETTTSMARAIGSGRAHVSEVLANRPGHGHRTRPRLAALLTEQERELLGWDASGRVRTTDRRPENSDPAFGLPCPRSTENFVPNPS